MAHPALHWDRVWHVSVVGELEPEDREAGDRGEEREAFGGAELPAAPIAELVCGADIFARGGGDEAAAAAAGLQCLRTRDHKSVGPNEKVDSHTHGEKVCRQECELDLVAP